MIPGHASGVVGLGPDHVMRARLGDPVVHHGDVDDRPVGTQIAHISPPEQTTRESFRGPSPCGVRDNRKGVFYEKSLLSASLFSLALYSS